MKFIHRNDSYKFFAAFCIFSLVAVLSLLGYANVFAMEPEERTVFSITVGRESYAVGEEGVMIVSLSTQKLITAFQADLIYDPAMLEILGVESNMEAFPYWFAREAKEGGRVKLAASVLPPGFQGSTSLAVITFKVKNSGVAEIAYDSSSAVLTAQDENILDLDASLPARIMIAPQSYRFLNGSVGWNGLAMVVAGAIVLAGAIMIVVRKRKR